MVYVNKMSVLDQHKFVMNPSSFKAKVKQSVNSFKSSFKSSDFIDKNLLKNEEEDFLKNDDRVYSQIVKTSISQIMGSDIDKQWYPNMAMKDAPVGYMFKGSPAPKKFKAESLASCSPMEKRKWDNDAFPTNDEEVTRKKLSDFDMSSGAPSDSLKKES